MAQQEPPPTTQRETDAAVPLLSGGKVALREWRHSDREHLAFDDAAREFAGPALPGPDEESFALWLTRQRADWSPGGNLVWCIVDPERDDPMGWIALLAINARFQHGSAGIGFWILPPARGTGVLRDALTVVHDFAFTDERLGLHRLWAVADHRNLASQRALRTAGYRRTGTEQAAAVYEPGGARHDAVRFELLAPGPEAQLRSQAAEELPTLQGASVRLRAWRHEDAVRVVEACTEQGTRRWLTLPSPYTLADAERYITVAHQASIHERWAFCVADPETDLCIGSLEVRLDTSPDAAGSGEIGYWTHPAARGQGIMPAALRLLQGYAFTPADQGGGGLRRLNLQAAEGNSASQRVAGKAGFTEVGRDRSAKRLSDGTVVDHVRFDLLAREVSR